MTTITYHHVPQSVTNPHVLQIEFTGQELVEQRDIMDAAVMALWHQHQWAHPVLVTKDCVVETLYRLRYHEWLMQRLCTLGEDNSVGYAISAEWFEQQRASGVQTHNCKFVTVSNRFLATLFMQEFQDKPPGDGA